MSDHDFDTYLTLLAKLLRLSDKQREAVDGELRAHLEDRLEELLDRGVPREEAVKLALAEFGDAAGLAAEFGSISRNRRKKWLMRLTTFSAAAIVLVAAGLAIFWPGRNAGPGVAAVVAQEEEAKAADPADTKPALDAPPLEKPADKSSESELTAKLNKRIDAEFIETPLKDALQILSDSTGIQFYIKQKRLEDLGVSVDAAVTKNLRQVRVSTLLDLMFEELDLTYYEKDDLIVITSHEDAIATMEVRVYDCRDLLELASVGPGPAGGGARGQRGGFFGAVRGESQLADAAATAPQDVLAQFGGGGLGGPAAGEGDAGGMSPDPMPVSEHDGKARQLIDVIVTSVDPDSWTDIGGPGSISEFGGLIVVSQSARTHKKVEHVLNMLREAAGLEVGGVKKVVR